MDPVLRSLLLLYDLGGRPKGVSTQVGDCRTGNQKESLGSKAPSLRARDNAFSNYTLPFTPPPPVPHVASAAVCTHHRPHKKYPVSRQHSTYAALRAFHQQSMACSKLRFTCRPFHLPAAQISGPRSPESFKVLEALQLFLFILKLILAFKQGPIPRADLGWWQQTVSAMVLRNRKPFSNITMNDILWL